MRFFREELVRSENGPYRQLFHIKNRETNGGNERFGGGLKQLEEKFSSNCFNFYCKNETNGRNGGFKALF